MVDVFLDHNVARALAPLRTQHGNPARTARDEGLDHAGDPAQLLHAVQPTSRRDIKMASFALTLELVGGGWIRASLSSGDQHAEIIGSYLGDAPMGLVEAAHAAVRGQQPEVFYWDQEPAIARWTLTLSDGLLSLCVERDVDDEDAEMANSDWEPEPISKSSSLDDDPYPGWIWETVFAARTDPVAFAELVANEMTRLVQQLGHDGYEETWGYPFPTGLVDDLNRELAARAGGSGDTPVGG